MAFDEPNDELGRKISLSQRFNSHQLTGFLWAVVDLYNYHYCFCRLLQRIRERSK